MNPITPLLTAIRDNPDVEINKACDGSILVDVPFSVGNQIESCEYIIRIESENGSTEFKVTRLEDQGVYRPTAICWINNRAISEAIAARIIANENAAQDDLIGLVKPVEEVLKGL